MQEIYDAYETNRVYNENLQIYSKKWETDNVHVTKYREDTVVLLMEYTNTHHAHELKKIEISSKPPPLPVVISTGKNKKKREERANKEAAAAYASSMAKDNEILENLCWEVSALDHSIVIHNGHYLQIWPEDKFMEENLLKRRADINGNLDSHCNIHLNKKVCISFNPIGIDSSSSSETK